MIPWEKSWQTVLRRDKDMTKDESIALAEKLKKGYANMDALKDQIESNEAQIRSRTSTSIRGHSYFKFFWPWLVIAAVLFILIGFIHKSFFRYSANDVQYTFMTLKYIIPIVALVAGAFVAGAKKQNDSNQVLEAERSAEEAVEKLRTANEDNRKNIERIRRELEEYNTLIPPKARTKTAMSRVVSLLKTDKAEDFEDAISKL